LERNGRKRAEREGMTREDEEEERDGEGR